MANVINKNTLQYIMSANTTAYLDGNWIINPVLPVCASKYWKIVGGEVVEMSTAEKEAVDAALTAQAAADLDFQKDLDSLSPILKGAFLLVLDEINKLRTKAGLATYTVAQFKAAIKAKIG